MRIQRVIRNGNLSRQMIRLGFLRLILCSEVVCRKLVEKDRSAARVDLLCRLEPIRAPARAQRLYSDDWLCGLIRSDHSCDAACNYEILHDL
jgi:hypothetical protein